MGAPNVDDWVPGKSSIVKTSDFKSPQELAKYLEKLLSDESEYNSYFAWKKYKLSPKVCTFYFLFIYYVFPYYYPLFLLFVYLFCCSLWISMTNACTTPSVAFAKPF